MVRAHFTFLLAICALLLWDIVVGANEGAVFPPSRHELMVGFYSLTALLWIVFKKPEQKVRLLATLAVTCLAYPALILALYWPMAEPGEPTLSTAALVWKVLIPGAWSLVFAIALTGELVRRRGASASAAS